MIWKDYLKLSEIKSYSKLTGASKAPPGRIGLKVDNASQQHIVSGGEFHSFSRT